MTPQGSLRLGNWLYLWLNAHQRSAEGSPTLVLTAPGMTPWIDAFPRLTELSIPPARMRFHDRREPFVSYRQRFGIDFTPASLAAFIRENLASAVTPQGSGTLVVNVRRGDYYAQPDLASRYGFDQVGYIAAAARRFRGVERVLVVSDDRDWCRAHLDVILRGFAARIDYAEPDPVPNFLAIAGARRLIGSNSTFSYWGAYVAGVVHDLPEIVMPRFHARFDGLSDASQLDPAWTAIEGFH